MKKRENTFEFWMCVRGREWVWVCPSVWVCCETEGIDKEREKEQEQEHRKKKEYDIW